MLAALLVCLIPTTIGGLLSAIGIAGMDRLVRFNVVATSGRAVEAAGDVDALLLDKTGTITFGNRMASGFYPVAGVQERDLAEACAYASLGDDTPEGRSILALARDRYNLVPAMPDQAQVIPFSANTRMSGVDFAGRTYRKGAVDSVLKALNVTGDAAFTEAVSRIGRAGSTPLAVCANGHLLGVIELKDIVKPGIKERFAALRSMGIRTVMVTGDNRVTAAAIAAEAGVDEYIAEATPQNKLDYIRKVQADGRLVAMCGDGTNDAPALAQADVGVAMQTGTQAAREAGNMVDLDSDPTKLIEIVEIGKQLLITRGALTTFSIANDISKYFAILPAIFIAAYPAAASAQHHASAHAGERHSLRGDLQRADHRGAGAAGFARREVPSHRRSRAAAAQPAGLWRRRHHRALRRHQAHRHGAWRLQYLFVTDKTNVDPSRIPAGFIAGHPLHHRHRLSAA